MNSSLDIGGRSAFEGLTNPEVIASEKFSASLHVASLIVHVRREHLKAVTQWIDAFSCEDIRAEIHAESEQGKLVVVVETENEKYILAMIDSLVEQPGVLNAALVYHEIISEDEL